MTVADNRPTQAALVLVEIFARAGVIDSAGVQLAHTLHRLRPQESDLVLLGAALALRAPLWGHVCVEPGFIAQTIVLDDGSDANTEDLPWPDPAAWMEALAASSLVACIDGPPQTDELRPLVWDGERLYLQRYWVYETRVADHILSRVETGGRRPAPSGAVFDALFPSDVGSQRRAAVAALSQSLTVITGGPGTGKTHTIAGVVAALVDRAHQAGGRPVQIALAAPTGKAAQRLTEAVQSGRLGTTKPAEAAMATMEATTIHRLLGARRSGFVHNATNPLSADVVIVDEMSMVSLPLMASLLDAVRPSASLILVGDPRQLASVEAGSVLRDLVDALSSDVVVALDVVFRQRESSPIIPFAEAVRDGDAHAVMAFFDDPGSPLELVDPDDPRQAAAMEAIVDEVDAHAREVVDAAADPADALQKLLELRVLTATRQGPTGRAAWNARLESRLGRRARNDRQGRWYRGRPVIVTENDYLNRLMNGDVGIVAGRPSGMAEPDEEIRNGNDAVVDAGLQVAFARGDDLLRIPATRLQAVDSVWALTIHKSQGSEFDAVVVTLPAPPSPLLTRELLYTAVTRARSRVVVLASRASVQTALETSISRSSGLAARMRSYGEAAAAEAVAATKMQQLSLWDLEE